ncbi:alpha/beta fold hydrolase [Microbacterium oryzae]|nr:alpha/beta fold hydrolase [Microbacterium oryzae]
MRASFSGPATGGPVVLLHGGGVAGWMWTDLRARLEATRRVYAVDLPGHGQSLDEPWVSHEETVRKLAAQLAARFPGRRVDLVGFSLGAQLAIQFAATFPHMVAGVVVVSAQATAMPRSDLALRLVKATAGLVRKPWFARLQARALFIPRHLRDAYVQTSAGITEDVLLATVGGNLAFELPSGWSEYRGPALVLVGSRERRVMRDSAELIHRALPGSELEVVERAGHGLPLQRPEWFAERVEAWLAARKS